VIAIAPTRAEQLRALRFLSDRLGLTRGAPITPQLAADLERVRATDGSALALRAVLCIASPCAGDVQRAAAAGLLDLLCPGWRAHHPELVGAVARRNAPVVQAWRAAVLDRDGHTCTRCGATENLHAHHVVRWADEPLLRVSLENGITLCESCHVEEHHGQ
jgi:hypothetical protein